MSPPKKTKSTSDFLAYGGLLHRITSRIRQSLELQEILTATVTEVRSFLQTDRVKVYRFHADESGQVVAESIALNRLPSLLGLNFPAGDIPPQAREMFVKADQRSIVDVTAQQIILSSNAAPRSIVDLSVEDIRLQPIGDILQRPVGSCHVDYLTTMGVVSSLVVLILHQEHLWGLLVSHHSQPRAFKEEELQLVQIIADQLSIAIAQSELLTQTREQVRREALINQITHLLHSPRNMPEILQLVLEQIVKAASGSGGRLYLSPTDKNAWTLYTCGTQPTLSTQRQQRPRESFEVWREYKESQPPEWTREDIELIESLSLHLAMAIRQNRLYQLERHNRELDIARAVAEESSRLKSSFLASTSHELRTPLASTLNCLQILRKGFYKNTEELNRYIQLAEQSVINIVAIINDVLDIAKIEAGSMKVELEPVNLGFILNELRDFRRTESTCKTI